MDDAGAEDRVLRQRRAGLAGALDRLDDGRDRGGSPRELVQVVSEGAVPTTVPKVFAVKSATVDFAEAEGATPTFTTYGDNFHVVVLGPKVPVIGTRLLAKSIGGRWVAGHPNAGPVCGPLPGCPARDLDTLTLTSSLVGVPTVTIRRNADTCLWQGCGLRPTGTWGGLLSGCAGDIASFNTDGSQGQPRVYTLNSAGGLSCQVPMRTCGPAQTRGIYLSVGTCPSDLTPSPLFGPVPTSLDGRFLPDNTDYTWVTGNGGINVLSCNPYHARWFITDIVGTNETVDINE